MHHIDQDAWYSINETISRIYTLEGADIFSRAMDDIQSLISYKRAFCNISSNMGNKYVYFDYISHTIPRTPCQITSNITRSSTSSHGLATSRAPRFTATRMSFRSSI